MSYKYISRLGWGALPPKKRIRFSPKKKMIILHYTASENENLDLLSSKDDIELMQRIQKYHMNTKKWDDIGYNELITREGYVMEGRFGGLKAIGSHCKGKNTSAIGECLQGIYINDKPTEIQMDVLIQRFVEICRAENIPPNEIYGHKDFASTKCPGTILHSMIPRIREEVTNYIQKKKPVEDKKDTLTRIYKLGSKGNDVIRIQKFLNAKGFNLITDGIYGKLTATAIARFQLANKLSVDGICGANTIKTLLK